jgi:predicted enzyme related to lactoylglutathione lyase
MDLDSAVFYTNDIPKIIEFYQNIIGLKIEYQQEEKFVSFLFPNNVRLGIKKAVEDREKPGAQTIFIGVTNIESFYQKFKSMHLDFLKELVDLPWGKEFSVADPDGNKIEFIERH